jgi:hypothetical protein
MRLPGSLDGAKVGLDDYLLAYGAEAFKSLLKEPQPRGCYTPLAGGIFWIRPLKGCSFFSQPGTETHTTYNPASRIVSLPASPQAHRHHPALPTEPASERSFRKRMRPPLRYTHPEEAVFILHLHPYRTPATCIQIQLQPISFEPNRRGDDLTLRAASSS